MNVWEIIFKFLREKAALHLQPVSLAEISMCQSAVVTVRENNTYGPSLTMIAKDLRG